MKLGVDLSIQNEMDALNTKYYSNGLEIEPFSFFSKTQGIKLVRLRLRNDPFDENGNPYGGGTNDLVTTLSLAKRAKENGMSVLLDFHFSDFWVDPSRQKLPKKWTFKGFFEILELLKTFIIDVLNEFKKEEIDVAAVQIGNETTNGMIFPFGEINKEYSEINGGGFKGFVKLFNTGSEAVKKVYPDAKIICHLEHAGSLEMQEWFFSNAIKEGIKFDVIGESYYPYWHGGIHSLEANVKNLKEKFHKEIWIVEFGYEFCESLVPGHHSEFANEKGEDFIVGNKYGKIPFEITKEGQKNYINFLIKTSKQLGIGALFYWEPTWIEKKGTAWASDAGQIYCGLEPTVAYNDRANETLFDFDGNANPSLEVFNQFYVDNIK